MVELLQTLADMDITFKGLKVNYGVNFYRFFKFSVNELYWSPFFFFFLLSNIQGNWYRKACKSIAKASVQRCTNIGEATCQVWIFETIVETLYWCLNERSSIFSTRWFTLEKNSQDSIIFIFCLYNLSFFVCFLYFFSMKNAKNFIFLVRLIV